MEYPRRNSDQRYTRKVTLPSGKIIEIIEDTPTTAADLHVCPECHSELVYPVDWDEAGPTSWEVSLRCPNCEWTLTGIFDEESIQRFDDILDAGTEELVALDRANMGRDVGLLISALSCDHLLPEDF